MADSKKVKDIVADADNLSANDDTDELIKKLNEIALRVAEVQGKIPANRTSNLNVASDPMDELGCEGCQ